MPTDLTVFDSTMQEHLKRVSERIAGLAVVDQQSYITAGQALNDAKAIVKEWEKQADAEIDPIKSNLDRARNKWKTYIEPGKTLIKALADRLNSWKEEERRQAKIEEDRKNAELARQQKIKAEEAEREGKRQAEERRKEDIREINQKLKNGAIGKREAARLLKLAGAEAEAAIANAEAQAEEIAKAPAPQVTVKPAIPTVAGVKNQVYYYAQLEDADKIIADFVTTKNPEQRAFLRQFIAINETALGKFAREIKDSEKATSLVPGVKFWQKG